jgi:hypothetical protein
MADRKLTVVGLRDVYHGTNKKGNAYTIYEVDALGEDGQPIDLPLRTFEKLPEGKLIEVEVEPYDGGKERTYTLKAKGGSSGSRLGPKLDELRERVDGHDESLRALHDRVAALESNASSGGQSPPSPPAPAPAAGNDDDEVPF